MNDIIIAVDIGLKGGICLMKEGKVEWLIPMPVNKSGINEHAIHNLLQVHEGMRGIILWERLGPIFGSSKSTTWSMAEQVGIFRGIVAARWIPSSTILPKVWQKEMFQGVSPIYKPKKKGQKKASIDTKAMAEVAATRLFPDIVLVDKARTDGEIDALLLAEYGRRKL